MYSNLLVSCIQHRQFKALRTMIAQGRQGEESEVLKRALHSKECWSLGVSLSYPYGGAVYQPSRGLGRRDTGGLVLKGMQRTLKGRLEGRGVPGAPQPIQTLTKTARRAPFRKNFRFLGRKKSNLCIVFIPWCEILSLSSQCKVRQGN